MLLSVNVRFSLAFTPSVPRGIILVSPWCAYTKLAPNKQKMNILEKKQNVEMYRDTLGQWLDVHRWTYFATFTSREEMTQKMARRYAESILRRIRDKQLKNEAPERCAMAWFVESHKEKKGVHIHALIKCGLLKETITKEWLSLTKIKHESKTNGYARLLTYVPDFGASFYISKYIVKGGLIDWDIIEYDKCLSTYQKELF